jgi:iron(III) transport system substrate-binding protein
MAQAGPGVHRRSVLGGIGAGLLAPALSHAATPLDGLYEAAKREGKLTYWGPEEVPLIRALIGRFNATFPGIEVTHFRIEPAPAIQRMVAEQQAGQVNVDAFDSPLLYMHTVLDRNLADKVDWTGKYGVEEDYVFYDGQAISCWDLEMPLCINTDLVQPGEIKSWDDLLAPKFRGKVLLEARGLPLAILMRKWGDEKTLDYIAKLKENKPVILVGGSPAAEALASGRVAVVIGTYSSKIDLMRKAGAPVDWITVSPIPSIIYVMCAAKGCAHPNAARLWAAWIASAQGAKDLYETTNFGLVHGNNLSPNGRKMRAAGAEVVLEDSDVKENQRRLTAAAAAIGALK